MPGLSGLKAVGIDILYGAKKIKGQVETQQVGKAHWGKLKQVESSSKNTPDAGGADEEC